MKTVYTCLCYLLVSSGVVRAQAPDIDVTPSSFDFGTVTVGEFKDRSFAVANEGNSEQLIIFSTEIQGANADQFIIVSGGGGAILNPGSTKLLNVRFQPTALGPQNAVLRIESNDPNENPININISGTGSGVPEIAVNPSTVQFGTVVVGSESNRGIIVSNQGLATLEVTALEITGADASMFSILDGAVPDMLNLLEQKTIIVGFEPTSDGDKNARLLITSNDPDQGSVEVALFGRGTSSKIVVDASSHDFGEIALGETASFTFFISNEGMGDLVVDSLVTQGPGADQYRVVGISSPFTVRSGDTRSIVAEFVPTADGAQSAVLILYNNDPLTPQLNIILRGTTLSPLAVTNVSEIDFGDLLSGLDTSQTVILTNTGRANLNVAQQNITGGDSTQFSFDDPATAFSLSPSDSMKIQVRFAPTTAGEKRSTLRFVSNDLERPMLDIPLTGRASAIQIDTGQGALLGEDAVLRVTLPEGFQPETRELFYRSAGESTFRRVELTGTGQNIQGIIPGLVVQLSGIEYYIQISAGGSIATLPTQNPLERPLFLPTQIRQVEAPFALDAWTYQMISAPFQLNEPGVESVLVDDYGPYNTRQWRLFRWENEDYVEYPILEDGFESGKSFWLITNDGAPFDIGSGQSTDASKAFQLTLEPGWNQIANPFAFPIDWPAQLLDPRIEAPVRFDGVEFQYDETMLMPWEGYFVRNLASSPLIVTLNDREGSPAKQAIDAESISYRLQLSVELEDEPFRDTQTFLGFADGAESDRDEFDISKAPPIGSFVRMSIVESGERYARSIKPADERGQYWNLELDHTLTPQDARIRLASTGYLPDEYELHVLDMDARTALIVKDSSFVVTLGEAGSIRRLKILLGINEYVEENREGIPFEPIAFQLDQSFPNPFNSEATINYHLKDTVPVLVEVYDLVGRRVRTLVDTHQDAGSYSVIWDGRNEAGVSVASGVYLYRLHAGVYTQTEKMLLVR